MLTSCLDTTYLCYCLQVEENETSTLCKEDSGERRSHLHQTNVKPQALQRKFMIALTQIIQQKIKRWKRRTLSGH